MIFDVHPELASKMDRTFLDKRNYVTTVENITEDAVKKYIQEQEDD